ncbi:MAG: SagB family peptide dehydrogenase, partial [Planctomycetes bacterium]|nr:SagB family peptide dehydrogenase [Planctomycetota bacterium]
MDNTISSTAEYYHERTKYRPDNISGHSLDWSKKPPQFKEYPGAESIRLDDKLPFSSEGPVNLRDFPSANGELSAEALARLLFFTNGVTGIMQQPGEYHYYRAAPSAGALYPTDIYLAIRNTPDIPSGIYNFHVRDHRLQRIAPVGFLPADDELFEVLSKATLGHPAIAKSDAILILSTIFLRSSWRYGQRAYRRCMLDTGHVFGNLAAYAPLEGFAATPIAGFVDKEVNDLLGLDPAKEGACVIAPLLAKDDCDVGDDFGLLRSSPYGGYEEVKEENLLNSLVTRSAIQRSSAALARALPDSSGTGRYGASKLKSYSGVTLDSPPPPLHEELRETILRRRSTRAFSGNPITLEQLGHLLEYAYRYD